MEEATHKIVGRIERAVTGYLLDRQIGVAQLLGGTLQQEVTHKGARTLIEMGRQYFEEMGHVDIGYGCQLPHRELAFLLLAHEGDDLLHDCDELVGQGIDR
jgi:hypothetical protein